MMKISPLAGKPAESGRLVNVPRLVTAYYTGVPDYSVPEQRVAFGTSGHRGSAFENTFNEWHILAITQAICLYRKRQQITGPLFLTIESSGAGVANQDPVTGEYGAETAIEGEAVGLELVSPFGPIRIGYGHNSIGRKQATFTIGSWQ